MAVKRMRACHKVVARCLLAQHILQHPRQLLLTGRWRRLSVQNVRVLELANV